MKKLVLKIFIGLIIINISVLADEKLNIERVNRILRGQTSPHVKIFEKCDCSRINEYHIYISYVFGKPEYKVLETNQYFYYTNGLIKSYTGPGNYSYKYDKNNNLVGRYSGNNTLYEYDDLNRLIKISDYASGSITLIEYINNSIVKKVYSIYGTFQGSATYTVEKDTIIEAGTWLIDGSSSKNYSNLRFVYEKKTLNLLSIFDVNVYNIDNFNYKNSKLVNVDGWEYLWDSNRLNQIITQKSLEGPTQVIRYEYFDE